MRTTKKKNKFETEFKFGPFQDAWLRSLESGDLDQTKSVLCNVLYSSKEPEYSFCCLGVACELMLQNNCRISVTENFEEVHYSGQRNHLPFSVRKRMCFCTEYGGFSDDFTTWLYNHDEELHLEFENDSECLDSLADMNDTSFTFEDIAAFVRKWPWAVFTRPDKG